MNVGTMDISSKDSANKAFKKPPSENRIEVITDGWTAGASYTFRAVASNGAGTSQQGADTDNVTVDN